MNMFEKNSVCLVWHLMKLIFFSFFTYSKTHDDDVKRVKKRNILTQVSLWCIKNKLKRHSLRNCPTTPVISLLQRISFHLVFIQMYQLWRKMHDVMHKTFYLCSLNTKSRNIPGPGAIRLIRTYCWAQSHFSTRNIKWESEIKRELVLKDSN